MKKSTLIPLLQEIFSKSGEYFKEEIWNAEFVPSYRGDDGGFTGNANIVGVNISVNLKGQGSTQFKISCKDSDGRYLCKHNAAKKYYPLPLEFNNIYDEAFEIFWQYSHFPDQIRVHSVSIGDKYDEISKYEIPEWMNNK